MDGSGYETYIEAIIFSIFAYPVFTFQHVTDRLVVLQRFAAQLELQEKQLKKKNSQLESQNESLKRGRDSLRDTLRKVYTNTHTSTCRPTAACKGLGPKVEQVEDWMICERHRVKDDTFPLNFQPHYLISIFIVWKYQKRNGPSTEVQVPCMALHETVLLVFSAISVCCLCLIQFLKLKKKSSNIQKKRKPSRF